MRVRIEASYVHRRVRKEAPVVFAETFFADVPEIDEAQAPVVASSGSSVWRRIDGGYLRRISGASPEAVATRVASEVRGAGSEVRSVSIAPDAAPDLVPELPDRTWSSGRSLLVSAAASASKDLVVAGGELHERCAEPGLRVEASDRRGGGRPIRVHVTSDRPDLPLAAADGIRAYLTGSEENAPVSVPEVVVYDASAFDASPALLASFAQEEAGRLIAEAVWTVVDLDEEGMEAYADARDAHRHARGRDARPGDAQAALEALSRFVPHMPRGTTRSRLEAFAAWIGAPIPDPDLRDADDAELAEWGRAFG